MLRVTLGVDAHVLVRVRLFCNERANPVLLCYATHSIQQHEACPMTITPTPKPTDAQQAIIDKYPGRYSGIQMYKNGDMKLTLDGKYVTFNLDGKYVTFNKDGTPHAPTKYL